MRRAWLHAFIYRWFAITKWAALVIAALLSASRNVVPASWPQLAEEIVLWVRQFAGWPLFACVIYSAVAFGVSARLDPPRTWDAIYCFLNGLRNHFFLSATEDPLHYHRVTLFKRKTWTWNWRVWSIRRKRWPWSGWLVPVARSGHTMRRSSTRFWASESNPERAEGVPGQVWARNAVRVIPRLPDIRSNPSEDDLGTYAAASSVSKEWLKKRLDKDKPCALSFCGIPVALDEKDLWGVIVIDSQREELPESSEDQEVYRLLGRLLGCMLQGS